MLKPRSHRTLAVLLALVMAISGWLGGLLPYHPHESAGDHAPFVVVTVSQEASDGSTPAEIEGKLAAALGELCEEQSACHAPAAWLNASVITLPAIGPGATPLIGDSRIPASADLSGLTRPPNTRVG